MRTLMIFASIATVGAGTFCIANSTVPFTGAAFVVGIVLLFLGACELVVDRLYAIRHNSNELDVEGFTYVVLGIVILTGMLTEDVAVSGVFAIWSVVEGLRTMSGNRFNLRDNSRAENATQLLGVVTTTFGIYMFFNIALLNYPVLMMVGIVVFLIGMNRFIFAINIQYNKPEFLTGSHERLEEAKAEEKRAMAKAKEAIRETNVARRKIARLTKEAEKAKELTVDDSERRRSRRTRQ